MTAPTEQARIREFIEALGRAYQDRAAAQAVVATATVSGTLTVHQVEAADLARAAFEAAVLELLRAASEAGL